MTMSLVYIGQQLNIYIGSFFLLTGLIGNGMNIFIFSSVRSYRTHPSTFYFLIGSIVNLIYIIINLIIRIVSAGFGIDLVRTSLIWCRIRAFIVGSLSPMSLTCSCLATIDQFLITSHNMNFRRYSKIKSAPLIVIFVIIIWCLHGIPVFLFYNIPPTTYGCASTNPVYAAYVPIYVSIVICAIPVFIMIIFGYLTYLNIRLIRVLVERHADRQVTRMTLIQVLLVIISISPSGILDTYRYITAEVFKDNDRKMKETFVNIVAVLISYFFYIGNFYMFLISSSRFRRTVKDRILCRRRQNQTIRADI